MPGKSLHSLKYAFFSFLLVFSVFGQSGCNSFGGAPQNTQTSTSTNEQSAVESPKEQSAAVTQSGTYTSVTSALPSADDINIPETETALSDTEATDTAIPESRPYEAAEKQEYNSPLKIHFIDVGQGDSTFIELPDGETVLIDAGDTGKGEKVTDYIYSLGYDSIDHVIATHPHNDHIGGMSVIIDSFTVGNFYMTADRNDTETFTAMLDLLEKNKVEIRNTMAGDIIAVEKDLLLEAVAPKTMTEDDLNNNSIVLKLTYKNNKFLFTGDAEKTEEDSIWTDIKCDVLKVGHHGSRSSSSPNFLKKVNPGYAVISCGLNNDYGHPDTEVTDRLYVRNIKVFRTDMQGTIIITSDGTDITVNKDPVPFYSTAAASETAAVSPSDTAPTAEQAGTKYVLNTNTMKIHFAGCDSVKDIKDKNKAYTDDLEAAINAGYKPCGRCHPY